MLISPPICITPGAPGQASQAGDDQQRADADGEVEAEIDELFGAPPLAAQPGDDGRREVAAARPAPRVSRASPRCGCASASRAAQPAHDATCAATRSGTGSPTATASMNVSAASQCMASQTILPKLPLQHPAQQPLRAMQVRLDGAHRELQRIGQIFVAHAVQIVAVHEQLIAQRQLIDRLVQTIAQLDVVEGAVVARRARSAARRSPDRPRRARSPAAARRAVPRTRDCWRCGRSRSTGARRRESRAARGDAQEDLLRQLLGPRRIGHAAGNEGEDQPLVSIDQLTKRFIVSAPAPLDELSLRTSRYASSGGGRRAAPAPSSD